MDLALRYRGMLLDANNENYRDKISSYLNYVGPTQSLYRNEEILFIKMVAYNAALAHQITQILLEFGENINHANHFGNTALHIALGPGCCNPTMIELLLENGSDPTIANFTNSTPLHYAVQNKNCTSDVIKLLLAKGANIDASNELGDSPLLRALRDPKCSTEVIACLLEQGADINKTNYFGRTVLHSAVENFNCAPKMIKLLLDEGAPVNVLNRKGKSPLFRAIENFCEPEVVRLFLERGADMFYGVSVFEKAVKNFNNECHCTKDCSGVCNERSMLLLLILIKFAYLLDLDFNVDFFITSMPDYQQLSNVSSLFQKEAKYMDSQLIIKNTTLREFLSGRKPVRMYPDDKAGGEWCACHSLIHFLRYDKFPMYGDFIFSKLNIKVLRDTLDLFVINSKGKSIKIDKGSTDTTFKHLDDEEIINVALGQHSAFVCELCKI